MERLKVKSFGPIGEADVHFCDLTLLVGPQASGKSIFLQLLKLLLDKNNIKKVLEQYNYIWNKDDVSKILDLVFGEGMYGIYREDSEINFDGKVYSRKSLIATNAKADQDEKLFYIPAQRILSISDGRPKNFMEFGPDAPFVLRQFSETLRLLLQNSISEFHTIFPASGKLKGLFCSEFNDSIFHDGKVVFDDRTGQKKLRMEVGDTSVPFLTWSAGQKEFMPLLLGFYMLCPPSKVSMKDNIKYIVIEEPEMGLHPKAIQSVILQIINLLSRGYKVVVSTHSPVLLEFAWAFNLLKQKKAPVKSLYELFNIKQIPGTQHIFDGTFDKIIKTFYFSRPNDGIVKATEITSLDAGADDTAIAEWGGISQFSGRAVDVVSNYVNIE
jgi:energy-coupling factor transporter ATP-binding protein EcfA2